MFFSLSRLAEWCGNELPGYLWCSDGCCRLVAVDTSAAAQNQTNPVPFLLISPKEKAPLDQSLKVLLRSNSASVSAGGSLVSGLWADPDPSLPADAAVQKCWRCLLRDDLRPLTQPGKVLR